MKRLEDEIDTDEWRARAVEVIRPYREGPRLAAALHVARTVSRRAERLMVELAALPGEPVSAPALKYINRLSDFLFVASRYVNERGKSDILWVPGKNR